MAPVAPELAPKWGVLEPIQTATSVEGQIEELRALLGEHGHPPFTLIGHSWGTWLGYLLAAHHPALVKKLILVGSGGFRDRDAIGLDPIRLSRLTEGERAEVEALKRVLADPEAEGQDAAFARPAVDHGGLGNCTARLMLTTLSPRTETRISSFRPAPTSTTVCGPPLRRCAGAASCWNWANRSSAR
jgi:pimeloyl-ACP methyl ester carboxylesterase